MLSFIVEISRDVSVPSPTVSNGIGNDRKRTFSREMKSKIKNRKDRRSSDELIEVAAGDEMFDDAFYTKELQVKWLEKAIKRFRELTLDGQLRIASLKNNVSKHLPDDPWAVCLYNTNDDADVFINQVLVDEGLAVSHVYTKATEEKVYKKGKVYKKISGSRRTRTIPSQENLYIVKFALQHYLLFLVKA